MKNFSVEAVTQSITRSLFAIGGGAIAPSDIPLLASKVAAWITSGPKRRDGQLRNIDFEHDFMRAQHMGPAAHSLIKLLCDVFAWRCREKGMATTAFLDFLVDPIIHMLAGRREYFNLALKRLLQNPADPTSVIQLMMDGPETERWFDPWAKYLRGLGVNFHASHHLTRLQIDRGKIVGATVKHRNGAAKHVDADYYVLAIPTDRIRDVLTPDICAASPGLRNFNKLYLSPETGFQLFFRDPLPGGLDFLGFNQSINEWYLALIGLSSVWDFDLREYGNGRAQGMISVELNYGALEMYPGDRYGKPMKELSKRQTLQEIRASIIKNHPDGRALFSDGNFAGWRNHPTIEWRNGWSVPDKRTASAPGTLQLYPKQETSIPNLMLASGSTRNSSGGDSMDGAAEAAKRATNAIIEHSGVREHHASLPYYGPPPELKVFQDEDDRRYLRGLPHIFDVVRPAARRTENYPNSR
ncbi:FAD-dependent oxidoreductase [Gordonia sp. HY002]|uniref:FAD-dependent oxidoreductase n=1 Tax=Gordonia zhenghanii TaxID=2911516 RepID=UPI001EF13B70|nr:FAD-dependent oxidoreductase [Gordonia zhenghanii]MCF8572286.1 FAD-dependent oxidoreductase [Gordonia zhenghanii]MCF8606007.1 FAD-dependent oxidoreductase [Gordonia zhenghanii]